MAVPAIVIKAARSEEGRPNLSMPLEAARAVSPFREAAISDFSKYGRDVVLIPAMHRALTALTDQRRAIGEAATHAKTKLKTLESRLSELTNAIQQQRACVLESDKAYEEARNAHAKLQQEHQAIEMSLNNIPTISRETTGKLLEALENGLQQRASAITRALTQKSRAQQLLKKREDSLSKLEREIRKMNNIFDDCREKLSETVGHLDLLQTDYHLLTAGRHEPTPKRRRKEGENGASDS